MSITKNNTLHWHLLAAAIVGIWGATFVNTKVLFNSGLTPLEIFVLRFIIAYVCIWFISLVSLVISVLVPRLSISENESF